MQSMQMGKENMQNKKPMILVLAGPNGSGKSTITAFFDKVGKYTNADDVVATTGMNNMEAAVLVDPQINIARIESRVAAGGHNVASDKVIERYYKSINNIKELLNICDIVHVYDNTKTPERIIRKHKEELSIYPNKYWNELDILELME